MNFYDVILQANLKDKWFRKKALPGFNDWLKFNNLGFIVYAEGKKKNQYYPFTKEDILGYEWELKEEWYEGDFKEKYPNGVLCWVKNIPHSYQKFIARITDYQPDKDYPFIAEDKDKSGYRGYKVAIPVKPEESPAIIDEE